MFTKNTAHAYVSNLTSEQADRWVRTANQEYARRKKMGGKEWECKHFAIKKANLNLTGGKSE